MTIHLWDYLLQSVIHSLIALLLVEASLRIWGITQARERFRYRLQILALPLLIAPFSQWVDPARGGHYFALDTALFTSEKWLQLEVGGVRPLLIAFAGVLIATSLLTLHQEIVPILRRLFSREPEKLGNNRMVELEPQLVEPSRHLEIKPPAVYMLRQPGPPLFVSGARDPAIFLSQDLVASLEAAQLKSALIHELAHIARHSTATTLIVFLARTIMFYNPISLIVFRRLIQDDERICDAMTVSLTRDPESLASLLSLFLAETPRRATIGLGALRETIALDSHNLVLKERIASLQNFREEPEVGWAPWLATAGAVTAFCYLVV